MPPELTTDKTVDEIIAVADKLGSTMNDTFPEFMAKNFLVSKKQGRIIEADREVVATNGLFKDVKKRYALHVINTEGKVVDYMKIMGMETRRSDTPQLIQDFLEECITSVVKDRIGYDELRILVDDFRMNTWRQLPAWKRGTPCRVSNLRKNAGLIAEYNNAVMDGIIGIKKPLVHFSVAAAANTNTLMDQFNETRWDRINDGDKIEVLYLLDNQYDMGSIAVKVDDRHVPDWFKEFPFDDKKHETKMIDKKLDNVIGCVLGWTFEPVTDYRNEVFEEVDFWDE